MYNSIWCYLFCLVYVVDGSYNKGFNIVSSTKNYHRSPASECEDGSITTLVERFFSVIFSEFSNNPPVCVCVQMCVNQPTYCYPNGCLRNRDTVRRKLPEPEYVDRAEVEGIIRESKDEHDNPLHYLLNNAPVQNKNTKQDNFAMNIAPVTEIYESLLRDDKPNLFNSHKTLLKYSKVPKVELRYRLSDQIRNMQTDKNRMTIRIANTAPAFDVRKRPWNGFMKSDLMVGQRKPFSAYKSKLMAFEKKFDELNMIKKRDVTKTKLDENIKTKSKLKSNNESFVLENITYSLEKIISEMIENDIENTFNNYLNNNTIKDNQIVNKIKAGFTNDSTNEIKTNQKKSLLENSQDSNNNQSRAIVNDVDPDIINNSDLNESSKNHRKDIRRRDKEIYYMDYLNKIVKNKAARTHITHRNHLNHNNKRTL